MSGMFKDMSVSSAVAALVLCLCIASTLEAQDVQIATHGDIELSYQLFGETEGPPLIMIEGLAAAVRPGGDALTDALVAEGFRVVRFDSRDAGRSTILSEQGAPPPTEKIIEALSTGAQPPVAYTLSDMAQDTVAVLDAAGIERAHVMGCLPGWHDRADRRYRAPGSNPIADIGCLDQWRS